MLNLSVPYLAGVGLQLAPITPPRRHGLFLSVPYLAGVGLQPDCFAGGRFVKWWLSVPYLAGVGLQQPSTARTLNSFTAFSSLSSGSGSATGWIKGEPTRYINFQFPI